MATPGTEVFDEHLGVIAALKDNYQRREDAMTVANINSLREQVAQLCRAREEEVKEAIKELTQRVEEVEAEATYPAPEGAHAARVGELEGAATAARDGVEALTATLAELEAQRAAVREALARLSDRERELARVIGAAEPRARHTLSLYAHVSKVVWDFEARGRVAGTVDDPKAGTLEAFDLGEEPTFEAVNALWEVIGSGGGGKGGAR